MALSPLRGKFTPANTPRGLRRLFGEPSTCRAGSCPAYIQGLAGASRQSGIGARVAGLWSISGSQTSYHRNAIQCRCDGHETSLAHEAFGGRFRNRDRSPKWNRRWFSSSARCRSSRPAKSSTRFVAGSPRAAIAGCSTAGEIEGKGVHDGTCVITAVAFDHATAAAVATRLASMADSVGAGERLAGALPKPGLCAVLVLGTGVRINGSALVRGLQSALPGNGEDLRRACGRWRRIQAHVDDGSVAAAPTTRSSPWGCTATT